MTLFKPIKSNEHIIEIKTETGHIIKFKIIPKVFIDIENDKEPFYFVNFDNDYQGVETPKGSMSLKEIAKKYKNTNLLTSEMVYDHIQIGFIYAEGDPNNHKWMLNFMDVNNKHLFNYIADNVKVNCPFSTMSWEDGVWHGRFVVAKKDIEILDEVKPGEFVLTGKGDIGNQIVQSIKEDFDHISLRYNIHENTWYCTYMKDNKEIGSIPCKNIICDVPFEGNVDRSPSKPKVTAIIKKEDISGISIALNALIIKKK